MSFKHYFAKAKTLKVLANKSAQELASSVESADFQEADIVREQRYIPQVDYSKPGNFASYGSAEEYYLQSIDRVTNTYPYDGSLKERAVWENDSTYIDLYLLENEYPRTNGYINLCAGADGWGTRTGAIVSGYGLSDELEYITFYGGPHTNPDGMSPIYTKFTGSNYYEPDKNRESNLKFDLSDKGATVEFWLKKDAFDTDDTEKEVIFDLWNTEDTSSADYGRCRLEFDAAIPAAPVILTVLSGTTGFSAKSIAASDVTTTTIADGTWKHYAVSMKNTTGAKSIQFDGVDDAIKIGDAVDWDAIVGGAAGAANTFSISMWVYADGTATGTWASLLTFGQYASGTGFRSLRMGVSTGKLWFYSATGTSNYRTSADALEINKWNHIVVTCAAGSGGATHIYINGSLSDAAANTSGARGALTDKLALLGNSNDFSTSPWAGYIDEVSIWNRELDSDDAAALYNNAVPTDLKATASPSGLVSWWRMGDDPKDALDGTNDPTGLNRIIDVASVHNAYCVNGNMALSQIVPYSPTNNSVTTEFYVNGALNKTSQFSTTTTNTNIGDVTKALYAQIGAITTAPSGTAVPAYAGKLSASLDEFRYWKKARSGAQVGTFWFTQVGGGTNTDPAPYVEVSDLDKANTDLGVYYKFNEGITGNDGIDSVVLDYSGRVTNGTWTGYVLANAPGTSRNTGSAIVLSDASPREFKDPIIYAQHPDVVTLKAELSITGSNHDYANNASLYNSLPGWIQEQDSEGGKQAKYLTQILGSYLDTLQLQIGGLNKLKDITYVSGSSKPLPFAEHLVTSMGLVSPEIFLDADIFEKLADRSLDRTFEKTLNDIKNIIYKNIYNNLIYIYKSKGTEKAFRNLIRCFGIDDQLIKINMYAGNITYNLSTNRVNAVAPKKYINFNTNENKAAVVYQGVPEVASFRGPSTGSIAAATELTGGYSYTLQSEIIFPKKVSIDDPNYVYTNVISSSLFGIRGVQALEPGSTALGTSSTSVPSVDPVNFQVFAVRDELESANAKFLLTSSNYNIPTLTSSLYQSLYDDTRWNLAVVVRPEPYSLSHYLPSGSAGNPGLPQRTYLSGSDYIIELHGVEADSGMLINSFVVTGTISAPTVNAVLTGSKRAYVGAFKDNVTGSVINTSDVKVGSTRFWLDKLNRNEIIAHALDVENYGREQAHFYAYPFDNSASYGEPLKTDTLALYWDFNQNTGSNAAGGFTVADLSSGSLSSSAAGSGSMFGWLDAILNYKHPGTGSGFNPSSNDAIAKEYIVSSKQNLPEYLQSDDMITILSKEDQDVFVRDSRPVSYSFTFEKSMYQSISEEMINQFATLQDMNTLIGFAPSRYRGEHKNLKLLRHKFYEKVGNDEIDFDKFYEYYKWFDTSLSYLLAQLVPASADFTDVLTVVENTVLERNKYQNKFPFLDRQQVVLEATVNTNALYVEAIASPEDDPQGTGLFSAQAPTRRQLGLSTRTISNMWSREHAPVNGSQTENLLWWRNRAEPDQVLLSSSIPLNNENHAMLLEAIQSGNVNQLSHVYRFNAAGNVTFGGVGLHPNKKTNFVYEATAPFGPVVAGTNIPQNIMLGFAGDVEPLIDTVDNYFPAFKQRLAFGINPTINKDNSIFIDSNIVAPFSIYSSSVGRSGVNTLIYDNFATGATITNLHHDIVTDTPDIPLQGPFPERFVGGRQNRHVPLNTYDATDKLGPNGLDSAEDRPEAYKILLGAQASIATTTRSGALGIVDPLYPEINSPAVNPPYLYHRPTAHRLRSEGAKRPVNIKNILMTTGSLKQKMSGTLGHNRIGNYQKNYQVIQTSGRTQNDPFFNDQSFNFAPFPETTATRGRFLGSAATFAEKSMLFDGSNDYISAGGASDWAAVIGGAGNAAKPFSFSAWIYFQSGGDSYPRFLSIGSSTSTGDRYFYVDAPGNKPLFRVTTASGFVMFQSSDGLSTDTWHHVVATFDGGTDHGGSLACAIYIDGTAAAGTATATGAPVEIEDSGLRIGEANTGAFNFKGYMCDAAVWNKALSAAEVSEIYGDDGRVNLLKSSAASNLLSWWKMGGDPRDTYNGTIYDQKEFQNGTPTNFPSSAIAEVSPELAVGFGSATQNVSGNLDYLLPNRTGNNSNQTIFVNRFSSPGGFEVNSLGYLDPAHTEFSVYNALTYRNRRVINYGLSGSASADPTVANTIVVVDQIDKNRGLDQRETLHCGPFGSDAAYGSVSADTYVTVPSWQKVNRNARSRIEDDGAGSPVTGTVYDNANVWHQIPQSSRQYTWLTASVPSSAGLFNFLGYSSSFMVLESIPAITQSEANIQVEDVPINFAGYAYTEDAHRNVDVSTHLLENANYVSNAHSLYMSGTTDSGTEHYGDSPIYVGGTGNIWGPIVGGGGAASKPFSVSFWMYFSDGGDWDNSDNGRIISWNQPGTYLSYRRIITYGGGAGLTIGMQIDSALGENYDGHRFTTVGTLSRDTWHHCVLTFAGGDGDGTRSTTATMMHNYVDGVEDTRLPTKTGTNYLKDPNAVLNGNVTVGNRNNGTRPFNGYLDEMQVWNKALSQAEITDLYARRGFNLFGYEPAVNNLVSWWRTGDIPGDSVDLIQDVQGFANLELIQEFPDAQAITTFVPQANDNNQSFVTEHDTTLNLNGPYQYPSWKQCRTGQHPVARELKEQNIISALLPAAVIGGAPSTSPSGFIDYTEGPLSSRFNSVQFAFEDNTPTPNPANDVEVIVSYANNLSYFSNEALNTRLLAYRDPSAPSLFSSMVNGSVLGSALSSLTEYGERIYPREKYVYQNRVRGRDAYSITNIWNPSRAERLLSASNSQGFTDAASLEYEADSSPWMLDPNYLWTETEYPSTAPAASGTQPPYPNTGSGAGELLNPYCRFGYANTDTVHPAAAYVMPFQAGTGVNVGESLTDFIDPYVLQGYHPWTAVAQAGVEPYTKYSTFASDIRYKAKDHSVVPEFRISDLMHDYVVHNNSNFLSIFNNMFNLTGSSVGDSSVTNFYSIYSQTDFMKYFQVVDSALANRANAGGTVVRRNTLTLTCNAVLKFLPYKGLYPAERTVELASLLSQSLGTFAVEDADQDERVMSRILLEPLVSPGILHNTIKSGVAVSNFVVLNTSSAPAYNLETFAGTGSSPYREYNFNGTAGVKKWALIDERVLPGLHLKASSSTTGHSTGGYYLHKVPFEAFRDPESYLGENVLPGAGAGIADLYDTGILSSSLGHIMSDSSYNFGSDNRLVYRGVPASDLYKLAADNFLCETINFFQPPLKNYLSREETEFLPVQKDLYYGMEVRLYRPTVGSASTPSHDDQFGMYSRASAFGTPVVVSASGGATREVTFSHVTPPYYNGSSRAYIIYKASATGRPTLDDIFANSVIETQRDVDYPAPFTPEASTSQFLAMQLSESVNLLDKLLVVPPGTTTQAARWLLQTKFETPVLNFWGTEVETLPTGALGNSPIDPSSATNPFEIRGMWHQYGSLPTLAAPGAQVANPAGIYLALNNMPATVTSVNYGAITVEPLISRVGFEATSEKRLGEIKNVKRVEEAIVVIPFVTNNGTRQFFSIPSTDVRYTLQQRLLEKYLFPPTFDYVKNPTVNPIAFYAFEFYHDLTQTDLAKIWQNLPPEINTTFVQSTDSITISQLADAYLGGQNLEWMVFKVKKLAEKDYNLFTKRGLTAGELIEAPAITSPYSYNWPYDYFSLVELIKIDEEVQYATEDIV